MKKRGFFFLVSLATKCEFFQIRDYNTCLLHRLKVLPWWYRFICYSYWNGDQNSWKNENHSTSSDFYSFIMDFKYLPTYQSSFMWVENVQVLINFLSAKFSHDFRWKSNNNSIILLKIVKGLRLFYRSDLSFLKICKFIL